jgi:hypothetical protein
VTESKKSNRGGKRPGAGRKPAAYRSPTALSAFDQEFLAAQTPPDAIEPIAQQHAHSVMAMLVKLLEFGASEPARVAAAKIILDRGYGKPAQRNISGVVAKIRVEARRHAHLAVEVLRRIAEFGVSEGARVAAADALLIRGLGTAAPAKIPAGVASPLGKREQAVEDARGAATGIFAPPKAPRKVLQ